MLHQRRDWFLLTSRKNQPQVGQDLTRATASETSSAPAASTILRRSSASPAFSAVTSRLIGTGEDRRVRVATIIAVARADWARSALSFRRSSLLGAWPESCMWKIRCNKARSCLSRLSSRGRARCRRRLTSDRVRRPAISPKRIASLNSFR